MAEKPIQVRGISNDHTARKTAEKASRENDERYRSLFDNMSNAVAVYKAVHEGEDFIFTDFNKAGERMEKVEKRAVIGRSVREVFPGVEKFGLFDVFQRVWRTGKAEQHVTSFYKDERIAGWRDNFVYKLSTGEIVAVYSDETERKRAEEALRQSLEKFERTFHAVPVWVVVSDLEDGRYIEVNETFLKTMGFTREEVIGKTSIELNTWANARDRERIAARITERGRLRDVEVQRRKRSGEIIDTLFSAETIRLENRQVMISNTQDISRSKRAKKERERLEAQLRQTQKLEAIATLAGGIAHDFNNILASVMGYTELAMDEAQKGSSLHRSLSEVLAAGNRAKNLIQQILYISRHEEQLKYPLQINVLLKEALKMLRSTMPTSIRFQENVCAEPLIVHADPTQIHQVIMNLSTNAMQAMTDREGVFKIGVDSVGLEEGVQEIYPNLSPGNYARLAFSDTGIGIAEHHLEKIFEPYFTTKEKGEGTGLGLSVAQGIVKSHGGHISCESESGKGTTFTVYLPLVEKASANERPRSHEELPTGKEHILVIDDEPPIVDMLQQLMENLGYTVTTETNSLEALEAFRSSPDKFDLIITDMTMPDMTGDKLAAAVKKIRPDVPVILITGFSEKVDGRTDQLKIDGLLMKPVERIDLARTVRHVLDGTPHPG